MDRLWLEELEGTRWAGHGELWLDPLGNEAATHDCTLEVGSRELVYTWFYDGQPQRGVLSFADTVRWQDTFHQANGAELTPADGPGSLFAGGYAYSVPDSPAWHWRVLLSERPTGELVLQMTNIAPWGEEGRAVRMTFSRS